MLNDLFLFKAFDPATRFHYFAWVLAVVVSITLHELAHGWAAIRRGDTTPLVQGRMTGNPMVHMGPVSIACMFIIGFAFGQMPVDPTRLRGKYAEALVAFAGPAMNFILAVAALTGLGLWLRLLGAPDPDNTVASNGVRLLLIVGQANVFLGLLNLMPLPPLDGSHILANFHRPYRQFVQDPANQQWMFMGILAVFILGPILMAPAMVVSRVYLAIVAGG